MVHAHGSVAGDGMRAYFAASVPHPHQPGPSAIAAQAFSGSVSWKQVTDAAAAAVVVLEGMGMEREGSGAPVVGPAPLKIARDAKKKVAVSFVVLKLGYLCCKVFRDSQIYGRSTIDD